MGVTRSCRPGNGAVDLATSAGEYLEYRIASADPEVQYVLTDGDGDTLFDNGVCPAPCTFRWPVEDGAPPPGEVRHTLSMQFFGEEELVYEVDRKGADGSVLEVVKRCTFRNRGGPDEHFEALRVFVS